MRLEGCRSASIGVRGSAESWGCDTTSTMERSTSGEKRKESKTSATMIETLPRGGEKHKRTKKVVAAATSTEEIEEAMGSFLVAGPLTWPDPVAQVLDC